MNFDDIFTVGSEIHEGWNYYDIPDNTKYRYYRFSSNGVSGTCNIGEAVLKGFELIDDTTPSYECPAQVYLDGATAPVTLDNMITYDA